MKKYAGFFIAVLLLASCAPRAAPMGYGTAWGQGAFDSNGERIYFTATSERGGRIAHTGGPGVGGMMMGGTLTCASCHGPTGRGGRHIMHMTVMDAPDIRWSTLTEAGHEDHGGEEAEHPPYDEGTFKRAVTQGLDPGGSPLDAAMPRWRMTEEDLEDLLGYLKSPR